MWYYHSVVVVVVVVLVVVRGIVLFDPHRVFFAADLPSAWSEKLVSNRVVLKPLVIHRVVIPIIYNR